MAWTVVEGNPDDIDTNITDFESGVSSIDKMSVTSTGRNRVIAVLEYTP